MRPLSKIFSDLYSKVLIRYQNSPERSDIMPELSANEEHYIEILYELDNPTVTSFAKKSEISKPAATRIVNHLSEKGYLTKRPSLIDKRVSYLDLDTRVRGYCKQNYALFDKVFIECISVLSDEEQEELKNLMIKIGRNI
jgi:Transcriptional regulators